MVDMDIIAVVRSISRKSYLCANMFLSEQISDADGYLERTFLSPASVKAAQLIIEWMRDAGLRTYAHCLFLNSDRYCVSSLRNLLI